MPNIFHASEKQARDGAVEYLTHFLTSLGGGLAAPKMGGSDALVQKGDDLFHSIGCVAATAHKERIRRIRFISPSSILHPRQRWTPSVIFSKTLRSADPQDACPIFDWTPRKPEPFCFPVEGPAS